MKKKEIKRISLILTLSILFSLVISSLSYGEEVFLSEEPDIYVNSEVLPDGTVRIYETDEEYYKELYDEEEYKDNWYTDGPQPDENGVLTFNEKRVPAEGYMRRDDIKKIVFTTALHDVNKRAFMGCHNLEEVIFPKDNTLKMIYKSAFEDCPKLRRFISPPTFIESNGEHSGVECEDRILYGCSGLEELELGEGIYHFGKDSFYKAEKLKSVTLPKGLHNINGNIFRGCTNLKSIEIYSDKNSYFMSHDGVLYEKINPYNGGERNNNDMLVPILYAVPSGKVKDNGGTFTVPKNVVTIGPLAFYGDKALNKVIISSGNERLCRWVFEGCENLNTVVWPKSLKNVGEEAFKECTSLSKILYTGSESDWKNVMLDIYTDSTRGDNHTAFVTERKPLTENMEQAGLSSNIAITFGYVNTEESADDAADWDYVNILSGDLSRAPGSKFDAAAYLGTKGQKGIKYTSSNKKYVKVSGKGLCTVKKGDGEVTITAVNKKDKTELGSVTIKVVTPKLEKKLEVKTNSTLSANIALLKDCDLTPKWYSSKKKVAVVNEETGDIEFKKKGKVKIYAVFNGSSLKDKNGTKKKYKATIKVTE